MHHRGTGGGGDVDEPTLWSRWQKTAALASCCGGVLVYSVGRSTSRQTTTQGHTRVPSEVDHEIHAISAKDEVECAVVQAEAQLPSGTFTIE